MVRQITKGSQLRLARFKTPVRKESPEKQILSNLIIYDQPSASNIRLLKATRFSEERKPNGEYRFSFTDGGGTKDFKEIIVVFNPQTKTITITKNKPGYDPKDSDYHRISLNPSNTGKAPAGTIACRIEDLLKIPAVQLAQPQKTAA